jgi:hypothetical protein
LKDREFLPVKILRAEPRDLEREVLPNRSDDMGTRARRMAVAALSTLMLTGMAMSADSPATTPESPPPMPPLIAPAATQPAVVAVTPMAPAPPATRPAHQQLGNVTVFSQLDLSRIQIAPALGAVTHVQGPAEIQAVPEGEDAPFQQVLLRDPGVVEDSYGQEHIRGEHANLTYRINGVLLPDELSTFGQEIDTQLIQTLTLIDGTLPAQFGFRTAGIVDIQTKSGASLNGGELSMYGGSYDTVEPSLTYGGSDGPWDYFIAASYKHDSDGIENPTGSLRPIHDDTDQERGFGYFSYLIDPTSRLSFIINASDADFQIPDVPNVPAAFALAGHPLANSSDVNENQNEQNYYGVVSYQKSTEDYSLQASIFSSYSQIHFVPDDTNDLVFLGSAGNVLNSAVTNGLQVDSSYILNNQHTIRFGGLASYTREILDTQTEVFAADPATGLQTSDVPFIITDNTSNHAYMTGLYAQDEWHLTKNLIMNYGLRADHFDANFDEEGQLSPRVNLVWNADDLNTLHIGYARYFVPPPVQDVHESSIAKFAGTTNAPPNFIDGPPKVERSDYFDGGIDHHFSKNWDVDLDIFYKEAHNLVDEGQFGAPVILAPFNYKTGHVWGGELSSTYKYGGFSAYGNFSIVHALGEDIDSQQFLIDNAELQFIQNHAIHLDHEGEYTASAGASYQWPNDMVYVDILYGAGLRTGFANTGKEPQYLPVNLGYEHTFPVNAMGNQSVKLRFDVLNVFDEVYQLRSGTGIGVEAPQYGPRRAFYVGLAYDF